MFVSPLGIKGQKTNKMEKLKELINSKLPDLVWEENPQFLQVIIPNEKWHEFAKDLKENKDLSFDYLFCLTGLDLKENLQVIYHLESTELKHQLVVKVNTADREENIYIDTVSDIWATAEFHEREAFDLFGIQFNNHPDLRRILLEDDWEGFPLRKDYTDEKNMIIR